MPQPGSLRESLFLHVWHRRQDIRLLLETAQLTAALGGSEEVVKKAYEILKQASEMAMPSGGDIRGLAAHEKELMNVLKEEAGKVLRITVPQEFSMRELRSQLRDRMAKAKTPERPGRSWKISS